jgi:hypothetical protein
MAPVLAAPALGPFRCRGLNKILHGTGWCFQCSEVWGRQATRLQSSGVAASRQLRAAQAWAVDAKQHGSSEDISKPEAWVKEAWVKEANLDLQIAQPQGETP